MNGSKNIYTVEYYTAERKKELLPFATAWIELESIIREGLLYLDVTHATYVGSLKGIDSFSVWLLLSNLMSSAKYRLIKDYCVMFNQYVSILINLA